MDEAIKYDFSFEEFRASCQKITQYYVEDRYPFMVTSELTESEVKESLSAAENIIAKIKGTLHKVYFDMP